MTESTTHDDNKSNKAVIIVGGGPSGACIAKAMLDRGYTNTHLYEAYPHPRTLDKTSDKAYVIALNQRGQQGILQSTGIDILKESQEGIGGGLVNHEVAAHVYNSRTEQASVKLRRFGKENPQVIIPRKKLTERLLDAAEESGVKVQYQHRLIGVNFEDRIAIFSVAEENSKKGKEEEEKIPRILGVKYDLLIGADGCNSKVRNLMVQDKNIMSEFTARTEQDSMEYQVAVLPENPFGNMYSEGTFHNWGNKELNALALGFPIKNNNTINKKSDDGSSTPSHSMLVAVSFPEGQLQSFRKEGYRDPLTKLCPDFFV